jgi:hypothetical protein
MRLFGEDECIDNKRKKRAALVQHVQLVQLQAGQSKDERWEK